MSTTEEKAFIMLNNRIDEIAKAVSLNNEAITNAIKVMSINSDSIESLGRKIREDK